MAQASKITPSGTLYTAGSIDEVTYNPVSGVRTNLVKNTQQLNASPWTAGGTVALTTATLAPDGTNTAYKFTENSTLGEHIWYQGYSNKNVTVTQSCYFKAAERTQAYLSLSNFVTESCQARFDLSAGTVNTVGGAGPDWTNVSGTIKSAGNGWYRCTLTATKGSVNTNCNPTVATLIPSFNSVYQGDGTSGIYIWGPQLEFGSTASIYVANDSTGTPVSTFASRTDSAGNNYITNIYDEVTYNPASGVQKNLLNYSQNFTTAYWSVLSQYASYVTNATLAPDGTNTATKLVESNQNNYHVFYTGSGIQAVAGQYYCNSIYVKAAERYMFAMYAGGSSNWTTPPSAVFNLQTGTVVSGSTNLPAFIKDVGNGWYRCSTQGIYANYTLGVSFNFGPCLPGATSTNNVVYQGDGTSGIYVWGAQQEFTTLGAGPTIYEPTGANAVPAPTFAQRTEFGGNVYVSGNYDEVSQPLNPVTDSSLIMHLDPAMTNSYPGTGTTWYDLSGYGNHATFLTGAIPTGIQKAPGYSTDYGGIIVLNGGQQSVANMPGDNVWANTAIKTSTFTPQMDRTFSIWVRFHNTTNSLAWMNPVSYGITGTTSSYTYGTGSAPTPPIVGNPLIASNPSGYTRTYGAQGILLGCNYYGDYGLSWNSLIYNAQNNFQIESENRINSPSYVEYSPYYSYISNPPAVNPFYGTWHNIVGTYSYSTNYQAIYVDGVAMNTSTTSAFAGLTYPMTFPSLMIGYAGEAGGNSTYAYLDGDVGQCLVYKRALSAAEVLQNFTTYRARYGV